MRAFLSHSSNDKSLVEAVAKELGRQYCIFDKYEFRNGDDFRNAIREGLGKSSLFVLFASGHSLASTWVDFEQDEAELLHIEGAIRRPLVFILDENVSHKDLPTWLRRGLVVKVASPKAIAREIRFQVEELVREQQQPLFVGRHSEREEAEKKILAIDSEKHVSGILIWGLSGIGRRTLAKKVASDYLSLSKSVIIRVQEGDGLIELATKVAEYIEVYNDVAGLKNIVSEIERSSEREVVERIVSDCRKLNELGDIPILLDMGGLLDGEGYFSDAIATTWDAFSESGDVYAILISSRKPASDNSINIPNLRVNSLSDKEIARLIGKIAGTRIKLTKEQIEELAEYIRGYPPAAHFAMEMVKEYGIDSVLANKHSLVEFRASHFLTLLNKANLLNERRKRILGVLSFYSPLPLSVLGRSLNLNVTELQDEISYLIDTALIYPEFSGLYRVSDPIIDAIHRVVDRTEIDHGKVAVELGEYIDQLQSDDLTDAESGDSSYVGQQLLELSRSLFRARRMAGLSDNEIREISLVSDLVALTVDFYHARDYDKAIAFGKESLEKRPESVEARSYLVRALAQNGEFKEANEHIEYLRNSGILRDAYFLRGFVARLQDDLSGAIAAYEESLKRGRRGLAVHRELANCYFHNGDLEEARRHIDIAQKSDPDNRYIVDLQVVIAIRRRDEAEARSKLRILEAVDSEEFYSHRKSTVEYAFGSPEDAYQAAIKAVEQTRRPTFAMLSQLVKSEIKTGRVDDAAVHIRDIEQRFRGTRDDMKISMRCKWELAVGEYKNALGLWDRIREKSKPANKALRRDIIESVLLSDNKLSQQERHDLEQERDSLHHELLALEFDELDVELDR